MIFRGTEKPETILRCLSSIAPYVDAIYMTATQDENGEAVKIAKTFGAIVSFFPWCDDFSKARNYALDQVPDEYDYILWIDDDDTVIGGQSIRPLLGLGMDRIYMTYQYMVDEKTGKVIQQHPRERIVRKKLFRWGSNDLPVGALHENLNPQVDELKDYFTEKVVIRHHATYSESPEKQERNLRILEKVYAAEKEHDPRTEFYLARAYLELKRDAESEKLLWAYVEHSGWDEEKAIAYQYLGEIYYRAKRYQEALQCYFAATQEKFEFPWIYFRIGQVYADLEDWDRCLFYTKIGLDLPYPKTAMPTTPRLRSSRLR
jgi:tetratricopeptide (TPR) repeat protein